MGEFEFTKLPETQKPDLLRDVGRVAARAGEAILGLPGNIPSAVLGVANYATGGKVPTYEKVQQSIPGGLGTLLPPTSEQVREKVTKPLTGEKLEPKTENEEFFDTVVGDLSSIVLPFGQAKTFGGFLKGALGLGARSTAGTYASKKVKEAGYGPLAQGITKFAVMTAPNGLGTRKALTKTMNEDYQVARQQLPGEVIINPAATRKNVQIIENRVRNRDFLGKELAKERIESAKELLQKPIITIDDIWQRKMDLNEMIFTGDLPKEARKATEAIRDSFKDILQNYGKHNKTFGEHFNRAENIYAGLNGASDITRFLNKHVSLQGLMKNPLVKLGLGQGLYSTFGAKKAIASAGALGTIGLGAKELSKFKDFLSNSSQARKAYSSAFKNAAKENVAAVAKDISKLNKLADHYESKSENGEFEFTKI